MRGVEPTPSPGSSGSALDEPRPAIDTEPAPARRRSAAVIAALALPVGMLTPWYALRVSARGISGRHAISQQLSGWQALSGAAIVCLIVAAGVCACVLARALSDVTGLGAEARRAARARIDGGLIATAGLLCVVALLWTVVTPPSEATGSIAVTAHTGARWGVLLTLAIAVALTAMGVQITAAAGRSLRDRGKPATVVAVAAPTRPNRATPEPATPEFDFAAPRADTAPGRR
jgi:hypothetical protein